MVNNLLCDDDRLLHLNIHDFLLPIAKFLYQSTLVAKNCCKNDRRNRVGLSCEKTNRL